MTHRWYEFRAQMRGAEIVIYDEIGAFGIQAKAFLDELKVLGPVAELTVRINSPGGSVFDGVAIYNALKRHDAAITVWIGGIAASIASMIAMAGDEVVMPENAMLVLHDPSGLVAGTASDMRAMAEALDRMKAGMVAAYRDKSGRDEADIEALMEVETWLSAQEAVALGLADRVEEPVQMAAHFDLSRFRNTPPQLAALGVTAHTEIDFDLDNASPAAGAVKKKCHDIRRKIEDELGAQPYDHVHAICGADFFDDLITHPEVTTAYDRYLDGAFLRQGQARGSFEYSGIVFEEYRGRVGTVDFTDASKAYFFPVGVPGLFRQFNAPADFVETANTIGLPRYATAGDLDMFEAQDLSFTPQTGHAVQISWRARKDDAATREVRSKMRSDAATASGATRTLTSSYLYYHDVFEEDPDAADRGPGPPSPPWRSASRQ